MKEVLFVSSFLLCHPSPFFTPSPGIAVPRDIYIEVKICLSFQIADMCASMVD